MDLIKSGKLNEMDKEKNEMLDKANIQKIKQMIEPLSDIEKKEAIKLFADNLVLDEFIERFYNYKNFALNMMQSVNDMKLKVGVDK